MDGCQRTVPSLLLSLYSLSPILSLSLLSLYLSTLLSLSLSLPPTAFSISHPIPHLPSLSLSPLLSLSLYLFLTSCLYHFLERSQAFSLLLPLSPLPLFPVSLQPHLPLPQPQLLVLYCTESLGEISRINIRKLYIKIKL